MCAAARLRWFEHVQGRDSGYTGQRLLKMELPEAARGAARGRTQRRSIVVKEFSRSHIKYDNILFCFSKKERKKKYLNSLSFAGVVASNIACEQLYNVTVYKNISEGYSHHPSMQPGVTAGLRWLGFNHGPFPQMNS